MTFRNKEGKIIYCENLCDLHHKILEDTYKDRNEQINQTIIEKDVSKLIEKELPKFIEKEIRKLFS